MEALLCTINLVYFFTLIIISLILYAYCSYKVNYWKRKGVIQLKNTSKIFGNFKDGALLRTGPGSHLGQLYHEAPADAPYVGFYIFHKPCLLLKDPEIIKQVMIRDFNVFPNRHFSGAQQKDSIGMVNLFGLKNPAWGYLRRKISPTLARGKLRNILPLMMETAQPMMDYLNKITDSKKSNVADIQVINYKYTADLISNIALGTKTDSFSSPDSYYWKNLLRFFNSFKRKLALLIVFFTPELVTVIGSPILFDMSFVNDMFWNAMDSREKSGEKRGEYIDSLIQLKNGKQDPVYKFEGDNLLHQTGTFLTGLESSSIVTTFTLLELAKNKECQDRARRDIQEAISIHGWTVKAFDEMTYLDQCLSESVRMHPPVSTLDRCPLTDYQIPNTDLVIEKGTAVMVSMYGLHYDSQYFEDPEVFNPERFNGDRVVPDAYIGYGIGPRMCVGMHMGILHVKVVISKILSEFEVRPTSDVKQDNRATFTTAMGELNLEFNKIAS